MPHAPPTPMPSPPPHPFHRTLFAVAPPGLEPVVQGELAGLGIAARPVEGGSEWTGGWDDLIRTHLHLRTASRILVRLGTFRARALGELERKGAALPWEELLPRRRPVRFRVSAGRSRIYHEGAAAERLGRGVEARGFELLQGGGASSTPGAGSPSGGVESKAPSTVVVRIYRDEVTVSLDASGEHLHQRGYRLDPGSAPLRETLAAGALLALGWTGRNPLLDPFAGSGTLPIEAALLSMGVPPGLATASREPRDFAFLRWPGAPGEAFLGAVESARAAILPRPQVPILASDRDAAAVAALRRNAERAGVLEHLQVERAALSRAPHPGSEGWIITNPPYGARLGERRRLRPLYRALGGRMRTEWAGLRLALFVADPILEGTLGLDVREVLSTRNGGIRVRLMATPPP